MRDIYAAARWQKSSYTIENGGNCVEVRRGDTTVDVRDSKNRAAGHLTATVDAWRALLDTARQ